MLTFYVIKEQLLKPGNKDLNTILLAYLETSYKFCQCPLFLARVQFRILHLILLLCLLILLQFAIIPLSFMTFSILKHTGQLFCRMSLNLGLSDVFSLGVCFFNRQPPNEACLTLIRIIDQYQPNFCSPLWYHLYTTLELIMNWYDFRNQCPI